MGVHVEGLQECLRMFDDAPEKAVKICNKAMRKGCAAVVKQLKSRVPSRWRSLAKYKVGRLADGSLYARAGLYNTKMVSGHQPKSRHTWDWFKAYWSNYGTLQRRDPNHDFQYKIKPKNKFRRQSVGQPAQNFFEKASEGWQTTFVNGFKKELEQHKELK